MSATAVQCKD